MTYDVFISHSSRDKTVADGVCAALEREGIRCWIAPRDVMAGRPFSGEIMRGIKSCRVMVLLFSASANASPEVLREVQLATTHRLHLVNFRIEDSAVSDDLAYFLGVPHWLDAMTQPMRESHGRLIESVKALLAVNAPPPAGPVGEEESAALHAGGEPEIAIHPEHREARETTPATPPRATATYPPTGNGASWRSIFLAGAAVLLLAGAGAGYWIWKSPEPVPAVPKETPSAPKTPAPEGAASGAVVVEKDPSNPPIQRLPNGGLMITGPVTLTDTPSPQPATPSEPTEPPVEPAVEPPAEMLNAKAGTPWRNSLGMSFVLVPISGGPSEGKRVWVSVLETRTQDYAAFWAENPVRDSRWKLFDLGGPLVPVSSVDWSDAKAFCRWLSQRERASQQLPAGLRYRLPTDHEWSCAVGLIEEAKWLPMKNHLWNRVQFPWGRDWPPTATQGNYADGAGRARDNATMLAEVGSFDANALGLHDLGGNVAEWCEDADPPGSVYRVTRGGHFFSRTREEQLSSARHMQTMSTRSPTVGFRVVIAAP